MNGAHSNEDDRFTRPADIPGRRPIAASPHASAAAVPPSTPAPLPPRPASILPPRGWQLRAEPRRRRWELSGLTELLLALPWLWCSVNCTDCPSDLVGRTARFVMICGVVTGEPAAAPLRQVITALVQRRAIGLAAWRCNSLG